MVMMKKGGCDEIGGKKFPSLPPPELRYLLYSLPTIPTRSEEEEEEISQIKKFSLSEDIININAQTSK